MLLRLIDLTLREVMNFKLIFHINRAHLQTLIWCAADFNGPAIILAGPSNLQHFKSINQSL